METVLRKETDLTTEEVVKIKTQNGTINNTFYFLHNHVLLQIMS